MTTTPDLNEFMFNPSVSGDPDEFIEIKGDPDTDYGAYSIVVIEGDRGSASSNNAGVIDNVFQLGTTNDAGYWVTPFQTNALQNGTQTVLIVKDFTGKVGQDLDTGDTGTLGVAPWSAVVSAFAVNDGDKYDLTYVSPAAIGATDQLGYTAPVLTGSKLIAGASRIPDGRDTGSASDWTANDPSLAGIPGYGDTAASGDALNTPGAANSTTVAATDPGAGGGDTGGSSTGGGSTGSGSTGGGDTGTGTGAGSTTLSIQALNGNSYASPYTGQSVTVTGIVTATDSTGSIGYYLQEPDSTASTGVGSRAVFVYTNSKTTLPAIGSEVSVTGTMTEYTSSSASDVLGLPEINNPTTTVISTGNALPSAVVLGAGGSTAPDTVYAGSSDNLNTSTATLDPGTNALDFYRALEGQIVTIHNADVVGATASGATWVVPGGIGTLDARGGIIETATNANTQRIEIYTDTGVKGSSGAAVTSFTAQVGDTLGDVTGVLTYYNGVFEIDPIAPVTVTAGNLAQQTTTLHADDTHMLVADYNIENMDALLGTTAARVSELARIVVGNLGSPDVLALQEIQDDSGATNDGTVSASQNIQAIIDAIAAAGGPTYSYAEIDPANDTQGGVTGGNIRNVFLYNTDRVSLVGSVSQIGADQLDSTFKNTRLPLVGTFRLDSTGETVTLVNVHNSSQAGSDEAYGSVQAPYNHGSSEPYGATGVNDAVNTREAQAQSISRYVQQQLAADPNAKIAVLGDFNDVDWSGSEAIYTQNGLTDLDLKEAADSRYTYVFEGNSESLDHTLGSSALYEASDFQTVHVNSEYPDATRESDHDPSLTLIDMTCFLAGSLIATPDGLRAVETLAAGDAVLTASGRTQIVQWMGHRAVDLVTLYPRGIPVSAHPVRFRKDAVAPGIPSRDLVVTPEHCLYLQGGLIPARMLVNGRSIVHDTSLVRFTVFHVELSVHDILLAEGLAAESWLDTGNRGLFGNAPVPDLRPVFEAAAADAAGLAAPLLTERALAEPIWRRLDARADALSLAPRAGQGAVTHDPALALRLGCGARLALHETAPGRYEAVVPTGKAVTHLLSRHAVPAEIEGPFVDDRRRLGVAVASASVAGADGAVMLMQDGQGWYKAEQDGALRWAWTDGRATLPVAATTDARLLTVVLQASLAYPLQAEIVRAA